MQTSTSSTLSPSSSAFSGASAVATEPRQSAYAGYQIIRRNGAVVAFEPSKIAVALMKAFLAVHGTQGAASAGVREDVDTLTEAVVRGLLRSRPSGGTFHIEDVQDQVELGLMRGGHHEIARAYVLYRERRTQERAKSAAEQQAATLPTLTVIDRGQRVPLDLPALQALIESACAGLGDDVKAAPILAETQRNLYDGVSIDEVYKAAILASRTRIEHDPGYTRATARLLQHTIRREILGEEVTHADMATRYAEYFPQFIAKGVQNELLDERLQQFDLERLGAALKLKLSKTELKIGEQQLMLPVLYFGDIRLLPPTYQGASIVSNEIAGLTLQGGQLRSTSLRNEAGDEELGAMLGFVPLRNGGGLITTDRFNYAGADYAFNANRTSVGAWYAQLEDIYNQRHFSLKHSEPVGDWVLGANLGYFDSAEDGKQLAGEIDNQAFYSLLSAKLGGHTFYLGYQAMFGDHGLPRVFANVSPLGNEVPTFTFDSATTSTPAAVSRARSGSAT